ncbi:CAMK/RAD53 protein kinase [Pyricularia oryzae]|nr:CAMK/RAD53 protein kinase [Pyricularia oryzae]
MDYDEDSQPTQATQTLVDPRRLGKQNSGFSDEEIADIICILYPKSENARRAVVALERDNSKHLVSRPTDNSSNVDYLFDDDPAQFGLATAVSGSHVIALKLSATTKDPAQGFTFGRHSGRCDICFTHDPHKRLSNIHFRIFLNEYGVLMLEDTSTNGTVVDEVLLKKSKPERCETKRTLSNGSQIKVLLHNNANDLVFLVQVPRREGQHEVDFRRNILVHKQRVQALADEEAATMVPGPAGGPPVLFPREAWGTDQRPRRHLQHEATVDSDERLPREWTGSDRYNRVGQIGKGAFATVHKVTSKYDGRPYAAKELDKRRFMKDGVLDQKVDNEMKIMRSVAHPNIVRYVDHLEWENRLLIIIMEYIPLGDLGGHVQRYGPLTERLAIATAKQLSSALGYLHTHNITHRDVKPDNILIHSRDNDTFTVKLTDFGLSKMVDNEQTFLRTFCGTLLYCAPEVYSEYLDYDEYGIRRPHQRRQHIGQRYDHAVDLYSLGGVLYYSLTGRPPFPADNGAGYAALLNTIMTQPLNIAPLEAVRLSHQGINCLQWMLWRRPEQRATVQQVENHEWLGGNLMGFSQNDAGNTSEELGQKASQLSLVDARQRSDPLSDDEFIDEDDEMMDMDRASSRTWSENASENRTFGRQAPRLFGEVGVSALGSSGVIPENRLNLSLGEGINFEDSDVIRDSFSSALTGNHVEDDPGLQPHAAAQVTNQCAFEENTAVDCFVANSQASENSANHEASREDIQPSRTGHDLGTSKRLLALDSSDENPGQAKPSFKRIRSDTAYDEALITSVPPLAFLASGRQINNPVAKSTFWAANDRTTWHLNYPEMTQLQHDAFVHASKSRGEEFGPGSSLWKLAMEFFPPSSGNIPAPDAQNLRPEGLGGRQDKESSPITDDSHSKGNSRGMSGLVVPVTDKRLAATFESAPGSLVENIAVPVEETFVSFGRADDNTNAYGFKKEVKVPKYAFKLILWRPGFDPSRNFRPWTCVRDADKAHFYIATKATNGIRVNDFVIPSHDHRNPTTACRHWARLYNGDTVTIWGDDQQQAKLRFRCFLTGSQEPRAQDDWPAALVSESDAVKLDEACTKAERRFPKFMEDDRINSAERQDQQRRELNVELERKRSEVFYQRRDEVVKALTQLRRETTQSSDSWGLTHAQLPLAGASRRAYVGTKSP